MLKPDIFDRMKKATDPVSKMEINYSEYGGSRTRNDDNVGGNVVDDLATMLNTNPAFKSWYLGLQKRANEETDIDKVRRYELMLMYPFKYYSSTLTGKQKADWEGRSGTFRDSDFDITKGGEADDDASYTDLGKGSMTGKYVSDKQREEIIRNKTPLSSSYKYTLESTGKYATGHERNPADNVMTSSFLTKLIRETNKHWDPKVMTVLCAMLLRWGINLPTYINRRDVPKVWWQMVSFANKNGGIYNSTKNMRAFLSNFGVNKFNTDSFQMREIRNIMMRVTDSKTVDELYSTLTSPQANNDYGNMGKAKNYFDVVATAKRAGEIDAYDKIEESYGSFADLFAKCRDELLEISSQSLTISNKLASVIDRMTATPVIEESFDEGGSVLFKMLIAAHGSINEDYENVLSVHQDTTTGEWYKLVPADEHGEIPPAKVSVTADWAREYMEMIAAAN